MLLQNDITGPAGFGAARFVSPAAALNYKIRFANDTNSAAHNVTIKLALDDNLDIRSFQFGIFGLDDFVSSTIGRRSIQVNIEEEKRDLEMAIPGYTLLYILP